MRQAQTLSEAQLRRVIQYCRSRRHQARDETIVLFSFYAGLRAKEIAALKLGDVFDDRGAVRDQFIPLKNVSDCAAPSFLSLVHLCFH